MNPNANVPEVALPPVVPAPPLPPGPDPAVVPGPPPDGAAPPVANVAVAPVGGVLPARHGSWSEFVKDLGYLPHERAKAMEAMTEGVPIEEAMLFTQEYFEEVDAVQNMVWKDEVTSLISGPTICHYLAVINDAVTTVSSPRFCRPTR